MYPSPGYRCLLRFTPFWTGAISQWDTGDLLAPVSKPEGAVDDGEVTVVLDVLCVVGVTGRRTCCDGPVLTVLALPGVVMGGVGLAVAGWLLVPNCWDCAVPVVRLGGLVLVPNCWDCGVPVVRLGGLVLVPNCGVPVVRLGGLVLVPNCGVPVVRLGGLVLVPSCGVAPSVTLDGPGVVLPLVEAAGDGCVAVFAEIPAEFTTG